MMQKYFEILLDFVDYFSASRKDLNQILKFSYQKDKLFVEGI